MKLNAVLIACMATPMAAFSPIHPSSLKWSPAARSSRTGTPLQMTSTLACDSGCLGKKMAAPAFNALGSLIPQEFKDTFEINHVNVFDYFATHSAASSALFLGCSLIFFLTLVNVISKPKAAEEQITTKEELAAYLTRPPWEYTGDEGFNVFLVVFHGYCFYDAFTRGDFEGFSVFAFLPQLAVCVVIQITAKLRGDARGYVMPKKPPAWKVYAGKKKTGLDQLKVWEKTKDQLSVEGRK
mmetsp:Transcript_44518/g.121338  ORF Transcript_44518/g.121338 Transcript_44518/m.121338 type:complete len:240 (-) Transcript_44518:526-1245(-)|eukprot:CAMPEP_0119523172 /NCGR_PEP_ID=MMETSP1344-20130328/38275_1 /TAXON_ID=236787 /ORGANISM="Florenciella parvula, Strain CCMP2471" /LENGTH=239 /DNA_ID=CAMNT_0007561319 /DNA_START=210 /DNA_END=929 /DNA_ORIENTATION=-